MLFSEQQASMLIVERHDNKDPDPDHDFAEFPNADFEEVQDAIMM
jgi:hypothetical protein